MNGTYLITGDSLILFDLYFSSAPSAGVENGGTAGTAGTHMG